MVQTAARTQALVSVMQPGRIGQAVLETAGTTRKQPDNLMSAAVATSPATVQTAALVQASASATQPGMIEVAVPEAVGTRNRPDSLMSAAVAPEQTAVLIQASVSATWPGMIDLAAPEAAGTTRNQPGSPMPAQPVAWPAPATLAVWMRPEEFQVAGPVLMLKHLVTQTGEQVASMMPSLASSNFGGRMWPACRPPALQG
mmetsp:Transcript_45852/g.115578  ORF Transcript_45852/g.115578 Transcript_45852/m.115578 type:complete len:200 (+) Transcript_45852:911-1510(+)